MLIERLGFRLEYAKVFFEGDLLLPIQVSGTFKLELFQVLHEVIF